MTPYAGVASWSLLGPLWLEAKHKGTKALDVSLRLV